MFSILLTAFLLQATYIDLYNDGHRYLDAGNFKEAEAVLRQSASLNPKYAPALKDLAETYVKLKRLPEAIDLYKRITESYPKDMAARGRLAELYSWIGAHDKSIVIYKDALELDPSNIGLKSGLATVLRWAHRYDEALRLNREILQADPENHDALKGLAKCYSMTGDLASAADTFNQAIAFFPGDPELYKEAGTVLAWQKEYKKAITLLKKSVEISPDYAEAYRTMGDVYSWMKNYQQSLAAYKKAIDIEPNNLDNYILAAGVHKLTGNKHLAEDFVKEALRIDPADSRALQLLREIREDGRYTVIKSLGEGVEIFAFLLVFVIIMVVSRSKRRVLRRKHKAYLYFIKYALPLLVAAAFSSFLLKDPLAEWFNIGFVEEFAEAILFLSLAFSFFTMLWSERRGTDYSRTVILAVGAHPDDIELGCGAFIMKSKDSGATVYGLTMSRGEKGSSGKGSREDELKKAAEFMELDGFWVEDFGDTRLADSIPRMKDRIEEKIKETGATLVLTHTAIDIHSDHQAVFEATKVAARNLSVLCYEDVSTPREFVPNYFIDVTGYIEDKMRLISFHKSQEDKAYMDPEVIKGRAAHRGIQCGLQYAEAFRIHKLLK